MTKSNLGHSTEPQKLKIYVDLVLVGQIFQQLRVNAEAAPVQRLLALLAVHCENKTQMLVFSSSRVNHFALHTMKFRK